MGYKFALELIALIVISLIFVVPLWVACRIGVSKILKGVNTHKPPVRRGSGKHLRRKTR